MNITIIGLGLIGGSMAIDLKKRGFATRIFGVDSNLINARAAEHIGLVDEILPLDEAIEKSELIMLAVPVGAAMKLLPEILNKVQNQVVTDVCSTKLNMAMQVKYHANRRRYVAGHPMAGTEYSGPWAAMSGLFDGKAAILCDTEDSDIRAVALVKRMYEALNMRIIYMNAQHHDVHAAYISHISHITSFALALTVLEKEKNEKNIFDLASGGFDSTVRLAKSSPDMWTPIFQQNKENIVTVLDTYMQQLSKFRELIIEDETEKLHQLISESNKIKRVIK